VTGILPWNVLGAAAAAPGSMAVSSAGVLSPWADSSFLERVVVPDVWPDAAPRPMTRGEAILVPAVARARHLICGTMARTPLVAMRADTRVDPQPYWLQGTDGQLGDLTEAQAASWGLITGQSPFQRMLWTADDILFHGCSLWLNTRPDPSDGRPLRLVRVPWDHWTVDEQGRITDLDAQPFAAGRVVLIEGMSEGVLATGCRTIRTAGTLETTAADVAALPMRMELHQTTDAQLSPADIADLIAEARRALADNRGILFTNQALETKDHPLDSGELLIGARNAASLDVARHMNVPADLIDATAEGGSLTYATTETRNAQFLTYGLAAYMDAVTAALSMDPVVAAGQRVVFDTAGWTTLPDTTTGPTLTD
jgi:hypothetical protein